MLELWFQGLDNRWLLKMNSEETAKYMVQVGIQIYDRHIFIRQYDDVLAEEYHEFLQYTQQKNIFKA